MESQKLDLMSPYKRWKMEQDMAIYNEKKRLMAEPNAMALQVYKVLMNKFNIGSIGTVIKACQRAEKRLRENRA
ncbi:MAG: hypothetical protein K2H70_04395 [Bacteroidales bacterium]|nr:hypothetical protein [Bacteroidales bacterium]